MTGPGSERDDGSGSAIPGAWARPASAFADEASVVRPERAGPKGSRVQSLAVLAVLAVGTAAFSWGITVALQRLDDEPAPAISGTPRASNVVAEAASVPEPPPVPAADPDFPALPDPRDDDQGEDGRDDARAAAAEPVADGRAPSAAVGEPALDDDVPAPRALRLARALAREGADDEPARQKRMKRARKGQKLSAAAKKRMKQRRAAHARDDAAVATAAPAPAPTVAAPPPAPAPTAASLTREAERLFSQGKLAEARGVVERALGMSRGYPRAHRALAVICAKQGDTACARKGYETYLRLAPDAPDAPDVRRILGM